MSKAKMSKAASKGGEGSERGVVYLGYVPPKMTALKLRRMLSAHKNAEVLRIYLAPENEAALRARRKGAKDGERKGDRGKRYVEGWVEFGDKRVAKRIALKLHGTPMGGARRSAHFESLWNLRYLSKFKWHHLTEDARRQRAESAQAFAQEVREAARDKSFYVSRVNQARAIERKEKAERERRSTDGHDSGERDDGGKERMGGTAKDGEDDRGVAKHTMKTNKRAADAEGEVADRKQRKRPFRTFKQKTVRRDADAVRPAPAAVLDTIFG